MMAGLGKEDGCDMDERLLSRIEKYKKAGLEISEDSSGNAIWDVGYFTSLRGNCFSCYLGESIDRMFEEVKH
jgi:hypothetical protein